MSSNQYSTDVNQTNSTTEQMTYVETSSYRVDYQVARTQLFELICTRRGFSGWTNYWNSVRSFVLGIISKTEMENVIFSILEPHELALHNTYILSILHNINIAIITEDDIIGLQES